MAEEYGLVMPFVCTASNGGPFDDAAFVAGCQMQKVWSDVEALKPNGGVSTYTCTVDERLIAQIDLVAMHFGWRTTLRGRADGWAFIDMERVWVSEGDDGD